MFYIKYPKEEVVGSSTKHACDTKGAEDTKSVDTTNADYAEAHFSQLQKSRPHSSRTSSIFMDVGLPERISDDLVQSIHWVTRLQNNITNFFAKRKDTISVCAKVLAYILWFVYLTFACLYDLSLAQSLLIITGLVLLWKLYAYVRDNHEDKVMRFCCTPIGRVINRNWDILQR